MTSANPPGHRPAKTSRIELRATEDDRNLLDRAATALGTDRSSFLLAQGRLAAQRVLADRQHVPLDEGAQQEWERITSRPARSLPGLTRLLERPSLFAQPSADQPPPAVSCYSRPELLRRGAGRYPQPIARWPGWGSTNAMKARASELACCWM